MTTPGPGFADHFSTVAAQYADARPGYPAALFDWIAALVPAGSSAWEAGCGSGQATRDLAARLAHVHATDPSASQIARAPELPNVTFAVEPAERCRLGDATVALACVAQALHWFDRPAYFAEVARVLEPGGACVAWGYQDVVPPAAIAGPFQAFRDAIDGDWPPERADVDAAYAGYAWPFPVIEAPPFTMAVEWPLARLLGYLASFSAVTRHRERTGDDPVAAHAAAMTAAWGDPAMSRRLHWPLFVHACRKPD